MTEAPAATNDHIETLTTTWNGITIEISYEPCWLSIRDHLGNDVAHLQVRSVSPPRAPLPITETGYRSLFTSPKAVAAFDSPVAFVLAWLEEEALTPAWRSREFAARQLSLF